MKIKQHIKRLTGIVLLVAIAFGLQCCGKKDRQRDYNNERIVGIMGDVMPEEEDDDDGNFSGPTVYLSRYGECFHLIPTCAGKHPSPASISYAQARGRRPCLKCARDYSHLLR